MIRRLRRVEAGLLPRLNEAEQFTGG